MCSAWIIDLCVQCLESVGHVLIDEILLEAEQTIELLMCLSQYQTDWRLSLPASLQLLMVCCSGGSSSCSSSRSSNCCCCCCSVVVVPVLDRLETRPSSLSTVARGL